VANPFPTNCKVFRRTLSFQEWSDCFQLIAKYFGVLCHFKSGQAVSNELQCISAYFVISSVVRLFPIHCKVFRRTLSFQEWSDCFQSIAKYFGVHCHFKSDQAVSNSLQSISAYFVISRVVRLFPMNCKVFRRTLSFQEWSGRFQSIAKYFGVLCHFKSGQAVSNSLQCISAYFVISRVANL
jgi:hypothetical protein